MDRPDLPTMADAATEKAPCRPGAWGSPTNCATHEGLPLDETGRCFWGHEPSVLERVVTEVLTAPAPPPVRRVGTDDVSMQLLNAAALRHASVENLLRLARSLNVPIPRARPMRLVGAYSPEERRRHQDEAARKALVPAIAKAIQEDRAHRNPVVDAAAGGPLRTVEGAAT